MMKHLILLIAFVGLLGAQDKVMRSASASSTTGNAACFADTSGASLEDCGTTPGGATDEDTISLKDEFLQRSISTTIGSDLHWSFNFTVGGSPSFGIRTSEASAPGIYRLDTSTTNQWVFAYLSNPTYGSLEGLIDPTEWLANVGGSHRWRVRPNSSTDVSYRIGIARNDTSTNLAGAYLEYIAGTDTNWMCVTGSGSAQTRTDSGVAFAAGSWVWLEVLVDTASNVRCRVNTTLTANQSTNMPGSTQFLTPMMHVQTRDAASKTLDVDYYAGTIKVTR